MRVNLSSLRERPVKDYPDHPDAANTPMIDLAKLRSHKNPTIKKKSYGSGYIEFKPYLYKVVKSYFRFSLGETIGYFLLRYLWKGIYRQQIINVKGYANNYGHKVFKFVCPGCQAGSRIMFFTVGPYWICMECAGFPQNKRWVKKIKSKINIKGISQDLSSSSLTKKKKALEKYLTAREAALKGRLL